MASFSGRGGNDVGVARPKFAMCRSELDVFEPMPKPRISSRRPLEHLGAASRTDESPVSVEISASASASASVHLSL